MGKRIFTICVAILAIAGIIYIVKSITGHFGIILSWKDWTIGVLVLALISLVGGALYYLKDFKIFNP